ncbi:hypothetical protein A1359_17825 [Methylomonas lenta]|uniref:TVP38/TMEM64 family membrane protein n=1 Tax=Methylomonas lenta TaxID=980561 RepID=A0A177MX24_9GAMM|nr:hypothetical protein A1359_17825 [Methylomonas lenta]
MIIIKKYYLAVLFIIFLVASIYFYDLLTLESIKSNKLWINEFITNNYVLSVFLFFMSCMIFVNSPLPLAAIIKVLGGFFFGFSLGAIYNVTATFLGCIVGFAISRYALKDSFEKNYYERIKKVENEVEKNGFYYFLILRLVMVVPYFLINITAGLSRISFKKYLLSTLLGVTPMSLVYANGGNQLEQINSISELLEPEVIVALILIAVALLVPVFIKKAV